MKSVNKMVILLPVEETHAGAEAVGGGDCISGVTWIYVSAALLTTARKAS